jgi:hypothetical protein
LVHKTDLEGIDHPAFPAVGADADRPNVNASQKCGLITPVGQALSAAVDGVRAGFVIRGRELDAILPPGLHLA